MKLIKKLLDDNGVTYKIKLGLCNQERIEIILEKDNIWVNGYGEDMLWDRKLNIYQNTYKRYVMTEDTGYNRNKKHIETGKQKEINNLLQNILK